MVCSFQRIKCFAGILLWLTALGGSVAAAERVTSLEQGFRHPPDSARPWAYWFVMDGHLNRQGITADLEAMKRVGIGGMLFMEVDVGIPKGPVKFMSPEWRESFRHANAEAARLGLVMTMPASPGWTGSGGPWVTPEQSMQKLVASETNLAGPRRFEGTLPQPPTVAGFYREVAVVAFPTPPQAYRIENIQEKAVYQRGHFSSEAGVRALIPADEKYPVLASEQVIPADRLVNLTERLDGQGRLQWDVPAGPWTVLRFGHTSTGANTRPAPEPGLGLECDKLDKAALEAHFDKFLGQLTTDLGPLTGKSLISLHIDSWEMGPQNWTATFRREFQQRRGYDLLPYLPVMTGWVVDSLEVSERFLWDLRQTVLELIAVNHAGHLAILAHRHGLKLSIEPYDGTPCDDMTYGSRADVPMGEFWRDTFSTWFSCTEASSIAHTYGKRIVQAEAFTSGDGERWLAHPATLKTLGDWAFCEGINRFVFHRYAHQPWLDRWPGMTMGPYGIHYERTQTWWEQSRAWLDYLSRCQFLLQQGLFVADVCFLAPEASPQVFRPPPSALRGNPPERLGYSFDGCTPEALLTRATVKSGRILFPDGMSYRLLVLSELRTMTPALLRKIKSLVEAGATVVGPPPLKSPSLAGYPACDAEIQQLARGLWGDCDGKTVREHPYGKGRVVWEQGLESSSGPTPQGATRKDDSAPRVFCDYGVITAFLGKMGLPPDFEADGPLRYIHRRSGATDIYFVANREERWAGAQCAFRVTGKVPEIWEPATGLIKKQAVYEERDGRTFLPLWLEPAGSVFIVFRDEKPPFRDGPVTMVNRNGRTVLPDWGHPSAEPPPVELLADRSGKLRLLAWQPGRYEFRTTKGSTGFAEVATLPSPSVTSGPWEVRFQPGRGAPERITFESLIDWSKHPDERVRHFSGSATYTSTLQVPRGLLGGNQRLYLDLGAVEVMAKVKLNGEDLGILWKTPFIVEVTSAVKPGANLLEVTVVNLWPNRLIGDQSLPPDQRIAWTTWNPFEKGSPLLPSGLLGPVTLRVALEVSTAGAFSRRPILTGATGPARQ